MLKSKKVFLIFTAIFLGIVLLAGIVIGTVSIIKDSRSVMSYKGIYLYEGVANYLSTSYKYTFMSALKKMGVDCSDTDSFWQQSAAENKTYGDILKENTERYLKSVLVGSYLFDRNTKLSKDDKAIIERSVAEVLDYKADGDIDKFNEIGETMGFTYRDFQKAAVLLYKYETAETVIFGYEASSLQSGLFNEQCDEYYRENYSRVRLLIIRTDGVLAVDPDTGKEVLDEFNDAERSAALAKIEAVRQQIADGDMTEGKFTQLIKNDHPTDTVNDDKGYYFSASSAYSQNFAGEGGIDIVKLALSMDIGEYAECELDIGTCFIYKCELDEGAYSSYTLERFFDDFYIKAAPGIYLDSLVEYFSGVKVKEKYNASAVITLPYNYMLGVSFS